MGLETGAADLVGEAVVIVVDTATGDAGALVVVEVRISAGVVVVTGEDGVPDLQADNHASIASRLSKITSGLFMAPPPLIF